MSKVPPINDLLSKADLALSDLVNGPPKPPELGLMLRRIGKRHKAKTRRSPRRFERWHIIAKDERTDSFCLRNEGSGTTQWFTKRELQGKRWSGLEGKGGGYLSEEQVAAFMRVLVRDTPLMKQIKRTKIERNPSTQQIVVGLVL